MVGEIFNQMVLYGLRSGFNDNNQDWTISLVA
jgi:hypothetical protein